MVKLSDLSILTCAFSCITVYSIAASANNTYALDAIEETDHSRAEKNIQVVQNGYIVVRNASMENLSDQRSMDMDNQPSMSPTPPAMIILGHSAEPFLTVDYLCWTARQDNMDFAYLNLEGPADDSVPTEIKVQHPHWKYDSGFRVGAGLDFEHDGWDTYLNYTWFHPQSSKKRATLNSTPDDDGNNFLPTWPVTINLLSLFDSPVAIASERWTFEDDDINWELGRNFYISRYLTLRPFAGLKNTWQEQKQRLAFTQTLASQEFILSNHLHFWGIGIRIGLNTAWYVYKKYLSIVGDLAFSGLWSRIKVSQKQTMQTAIATTRPLNYYYSFHAIRPVIEWALGMQWDCWLYENSMKFSLRAAWEEQVWIHQNALPEVVIPLGAHGRGGDLSLEGLTVRARFDF